jgi:hypothetical protein
MAQRRRAKAKPKRRKAAAKPILHAHVSVKKKFASVGAAKSALRHACKGDSDAVVLVRGKFVAGCPSSSHRSDDGPPINGSRHRRHRR